MRRCLLALALCLAAFAARANSLTEEIGMGTTATTPQNPRSGNLTNNLGAAFDLSEHVVLQTGLSLMLSDATPRPAGSPFPNSPSSLIASFSGGLDFEASENVTLSVGVDVSPANTVLSPSQITFRDNSTGALVLANDQLRTKSSNGALDVMVSYDSAGDSNLEWGFSTGLTANHYDTDQSIVRLQTDNGQVYTTQQVEASCQVSGKCSRALLSALRAKPGSLDSLKFSAGGLITAFQDTDLSVYVDYYGYQQDPATAGYFSVGAAGRTSVSGGSGIPIAPLHFLTRTELAHRFGDFSAKVWVTAGHYMDQTGQTTRGIGTKLQYKFTKAFRLWASLGVQRDTDETGLATNSTNMALGVGYRF
jgi:hypothetical protein